MSFGRRPRRSEYTVLPLDPSPARSSPASRRRRCRTRLLLSIACTILLLCLVIVAQGIPPSYDDVRTFEGRLPQHSFASDAHSPRYLRFPRHLWGHGLNNVLQEALLMSYLAYVSNVSFVFEDYTWSHTPLPWTVYGLALRPTRIPMNAIISGPTAGGPMLENPHAPLAVSAEFYRRVCPIPDVTISATDAPKDADGADLINWWHSQIAPLDVRCIEIDAGPQDLFDRTLFGGPRILSLFGPLAASPILRDFVWSPLVLSALARNFVVLQPRFAKDVLDPDPVHVTLEGVVAVHLRRGDYIRHCPNLAMWGSRYMGINQHQTLPDRFDPDDGPGANKEARLSSYRIHCYPSIHEVLERLRAVRTAQPSLTRVHLLSNEYAWSLRGLVRALKADGWSDVSTTHDLVLDSEQMYVSMAVDMAIAERAEVFLGNGFSSLSSNVVMLRLARGMDPSNIRFL